MAKISSYNDIDVDNSVVLAERAFNYVKGGSIKNSIVAAEELLTGTNVRVTNTFLVTPNGIRPIKDEVFGKPEIFDKVPPSLTDRNLLSERIHPYVNPAIILFKSMMAIRYDPSLQPK